MLTVSDVFFVTMLSPGVLLLSGCGETKEVSEPTSDLRVSEAVGTDQIPTTSKPKLENSRPPLNCPVMITAKSNPPNRYNPRSLIFILKENSDFDPERDDVCEGDIKNLWPDLSRFGAEIETHLPNIRSIGGIMQALPNFPVTEAGLKTHIDEAAKAENLADRLNGVDRSNLEGGMEYHNEIRFLIRALENNYWLQEHAPTIENILSNYDLKIEGFFGEKYAYCYHPHSYCRGYRNSSGVKPEDRIKDESQYKLESFGPGFGWFSFREPK